MVIPTRMLAFCVDSRFPSVLLAFRRAFGFILPVLFHLPPVQMQDLPGQQCSLCSSFIFGRDKSLHLLSLHCAWLLSCLVLNCTEQKSVSDQVFLELTGIWFLLYNLRLPSCRCYLSNLTWGCVHRDRLVSGIVLMT